MSVMEITSVSSKGQVVIPDRVRSELGLHAGDKLMVLTDGSSVLMRRLAAPRLEAFKSLLLESRDLARRAGLKPSDVNKAIRKVRRAAAH